MKNFLESWGPLLNWEQCVPLCPPKMLVFTRVYVCVKAKLTFVIFWIFFCAPFPNSFFKGHFQEMGFYWSDCTGYFHYASRGFCSILLPADVQVEKPFLHQQGTTGSTEKEEGESQRGRSYSGRRFQWELQQYFTGTVLGKLSYK